MNKHFYTKNETESNIFLWVHKKMILRKILLYGSTKNEMKKPFYMGPLKMKLKETFLYGPHLNETEFLNIYNAYQKH